jgi:hypothetical protein
MHFALENQIARIMHQNHMSMIEKPMRLTLMYVCKCKDENGNDFFLVYKDGSYLFLTQEEFDSFSQYIKNIT